MDKDQNDESSGRENNLLDMDLREETDGAQDRRQLEGEEINRNGVGWVKNYNKLMAPEELDKSRGIRQKFESKLVKYPYSWWEDMNSRDEERIHLDSVVVRDEIGQESYDDTWSVRDNNENPALSQFPSKLGKQIIRMWSKPQDNIWDPFAGHFSRPFLSNHFDRDYWGQDASREYFEMTKQSILERTQGGLLDDPVITDEEDEVEVNLNGNSLKLQNKDSRKSGDVPDNWADFTLTSPPYFDLEYYGPEEEQLGNTNEGDYEGFMDDMEEILAHNFRILKEGRYAVYVVNDFRQNCMDGGQGLTPYHRDLLNKAEEAGFTIHDVCMYPTGVSGGMFAQQLIHMEITGKIHEFICVFRKPRTDENGEIDDWQPRGLHFDTYPPQHTLDEYGQEYYDQWVQDRYNRGLNVEQWIPLCDSEPTDESDFRM